MEISDLEAVVEEAVHPTRRWTRWLRRAVGWGLVVVLVAGVWLAHGAGGQRLVLDAMLSRIRGGLAGELTVEGVRSGSLLFGATLSGVRLTSGDGRPFLEVDSVEVDYSLVGLIRGETRLSRVILWAPRVHVSTYPGDDGPNVRRLLRSDPSEADTAGASIDVQVGRLEIHRGLVEILSPVEGTAPERVPTIPLPDGGGTLTRLGLEGLDARMDDARIRIGGDEDPFSGLLRSLALDVSILDEPLRITEARGVFAFGARGITLEDAAVSLPASRLQGRLRVGPGSEGGAWRFVMDATADPASLADLSWLDPRLTEGTFRGRIQVAAGGGVDVILHDVQGELGESEFAADGEFGLDDGVVFRGLEVVASPLALRQLEPWTGAPPLDGWLTGRVRLSGRLEALTTDGRVTLVPTGYGGRPSIGEVRGVVHLGRDPGVTNLRGRLDPLNFELLQALAPSVPLTGRAGVEFQVSGRTRDGFRFTTDVSPQRDSGAPSRVLLQGTARRDASDVWSLDTRADITALGLDLVREVAPALELQGTVDGTIRAQGTLTDLHLTGDVALGGGTGTLDARFDATDLASRYQASAELDGVELSQVAARLPAPTRWSGSFTVDGSGLSLDSLDAVAEIVAHQARVGGLYVDTVTASARAVGGLLTVDTLTAVLGGARVWGSGALGLTGEALGEATLSFDTPDLVGLRPVFMGDSLIVRDSLGNLEQIRLQMEGVDLDTLPRAEDVAMSGAARGMLRIAGSLDAFDLEVTATLEGGVYRRHSLGRAEITASARGLPATTGDWTLVADVGDVDVFQRLYEGGHLELGGTGTAGGGWIELRRSDVERYGVSGDFALDSLGGRVDLELATLRFDSVQWELARPAALAWDEGGVTVTDVEMLLEGEDAKRITAAGRLSRSGQSDFTLDMEGVRFRRLARFAQFQEDAIGGEGTIFARILGPADDPSIEATLEVQEPRYGDVSVGLLTGEISYRGRSADVRFEARSDDVTVFTAGGRIPVDLSLSAVEERVPGGVDMDVQVRADSLEAANLLAPLALMENVRGWVSGELNLRGTLVDPAPSGSIRLQQGGWLIPAVGVRHSNVTALLTLFPDRRVEVAAAARARGVSDVTGSITFTELTNPALDLTMTFQQFRAVDRLDVTGLVSGNTRLTGTYDRPVVQGSLSVDEGTLFLEEFARSAQVVDLTATDPALWDMLAQMDTLAFASRPLIADLRNPFLENLRVDVELAVPRNVWLRSPDMNVEIGGDLIVAYDRGERDLVMVGDLQALRGSYSVLGRRFEVESGTVGFIGVPGINPTLDIEAMTRIRVAGGGESFDVSASVTGTLIQPRVTLSSEEQGLAESDLVSYLIFGRPTYQLASSQQSAVGGIGSAVGSVAVGTVGTAFGSALAQGWGLDYISISQAGDFTGFQDLQATTQVEIGQYVSEDVFLVLVLKKPSDQGGSAANAFGARVEWALTENLTAEGFVEDRFLRNGYLGAGEFSQQSRKVLGVFIFREWGY